MTQLDRQASLESSYNQQAAAYKAQTAASVGQAVGAIGTSFVGMAQAGMFKGKTPTTTPTTPATTTGTIASTPSSGFNINC